jgi:hypothetical protein
LSDNSLSKMSWKSQLNALTLILSIFEFYFVNLLVVWLPLAAAASY